MNTTAILAFIAFVLLFVKREHATNKKEEVPKKAVPKKSTTDKKK